ncbi:hypothetical protein HY213_00140 [Candidatus Peregrinibacteria bacterium]|nr:hypothetical protein [Candidatus Peregrinibacteria bacterium]
MHTGIEKGDQSGNTQRLRTIVDIPADQRHPLLRDVHDNIGDLLSAAREGTCNDDQDNLILLIYGDSKKHKVGMQRVLLERRTEILKEREANTHVDEADDEENTEQRKPVDRKDSTAKPSSRFNWKSLLFWRKADESSNSPSGAIDKQPATGKTIGDFTRQMQLTEDLLRQAKNTTSLNSKRKEAASMALAAAIQARSIFRGFGSTVQKNSNMTLKQLDKQVEECQRMNEELFYT